MTAPGIGSRDDRRLADRLVAARLIDVDQLDAAVAAATVQGRPVIDTIAALGLAQPVDIQRILARDLGLARIDLLADPPAPALLERADPDLCRRARLVPWRLKGSRLIVACATPGPETLLTMRAAWGPDVEPALADPAALSWVLQRLAPAPATPSRLSPMPAALSYGFICAAAAALAWAPGPTALALAAAGLAAGLATLATLGRIAWAALDAPPPTPALALAAGRLDPDRLPLYSILVPTAGAKGLGELAAWLDQLDYPADRQDRRLLIGDDDIATLRAVEQFGLAAGFELVRLPAGVRGRDAALRHGLAGARGAYAVVWDPTDRPDPAQLRLAAACFATEPERLGALIPRRWPTGGGWRAWLWNHAMRPGLAHLGWPQPLPPTGTHVRTAALRALPAPASGGALGLQLTAQGWTVAALDSDTAAGRSRRRTGLDAWLVRPVISGGRLAPAARWGYLLATVGSALGDRVQPILWLILAAGLAYGGVLPYLGLAELAIGYAGLAYVIALVAERTPAATDRDRLPWRRPAVSS